MIPVVFSGTRNTSPTASNETLGGVYIPSSSLLIAQLMGRDADGASTPPSAPISDTLGLSWTTVTNNAVGTFNRALFWYTTGGSNSTETVSWNWGSNVSLAAYQVSVFTGVNLTTPFVSGTTVTKGATSSSAISAGDVPTPASVNNLQFFVANHTANSATPEANWVESSDVAIVAGAAAVWSAYTTGGAGDTTPTSTMAGSGGWRSYYFEIQSAPASGGGSTSRARVLALRRRRRG